MALRVYGIVMHEGHAGAPKLPPEVRGVALRELAAITEESDYSAQAAADADPRRHLAIVGALFDHDAVLPAPIGTTFRNEEVLTRWMDLHYVALSDALAWVEDRFAARLHINRANARNGDKDGGSDLAAVAAEITRSLRRHAVSTVPLRTEEITGLVLSAAFLVERQLWKEFADAVDEERERHANVHIELTGPWPPYDFVRLQFGA